MSPSNKTRPPASMKHRQQFPLWSLISVLLLATLATSMACVADGHHAESSHYRSVKINPNITVLQGKGGNIALFSGPDGLLMIDNDYQKASPHAYRQA